MSKASAAVIPSDVPKKWALTEGGSYFGPAHTRDRLPAGMFTCGHSPSIGPHLTERKLETDKLLQLPDTATLKIVAEFETFWGLREDFKSRGFLLKRGYLLWGPPGSGKTAAISILMRKIIDEYDGLVVILNDIQVTTLCLSMLRRIEPLRPIVVVMEDLDALVEKQDESAFLALLDGEAQIDNAVFIASTNYPERLDKRFVDRPSRFDTIQFVGMPSAAAREAYLRAKEPSLTEDELTEWVRLSKGFSVAHLKEMIIAVKCFKQPLAYVVARLEKMKARQPTSEDAPDRTSMGILPPFQNGHAEQWGASKD